MHFSRTPLNGVWLVEQTRHEDARGFFARTFSPDMFIASGLSFNPQQHSMSHNKLAGTLRGMHLQKPPQSEQKFVRCTRGAVFDVALDLRETSPTYKQWYGTELTAENGHSLFIPRGCAHGFITLEDNCDMLYLIDTPYAADLASGVRWDDAAFGIAWPRQPVVVSDRDNAWPDYAA